MQDYCGPYFLSIQKPFTKDKKKKTKILLKIMLRQGEL